MSHEFKIWPDQTMLCGVSCSWTSEKNLLLTWELAKNIFMTCWLSGERSLPFGLLVCKTFEPRWLSAPALGLYVYDHYFQTSFTLRPLGQLKPNFMWSLLGHFQDHWSSGFDFVIVSLSVQNFKVVYLSQNIHCCWSKYVLFFYF